MGKLEAHAGITMFLKYAMESLIARQKYGNLLKNYVKCWTWVQPTEAIIFTFLSCKMLKKSLCYYKGSTIIYHLWSNVCVIKINFVMSQIQTVKIKQYPSIPTSKLHQPLHCMLTALYKRGYAFISLSLRSSFTCANLIDLHSVCMYASFVFWGCFNSFVLWFFFHGSECKLIVVCYSCLLLCLEETLPFRVTIQHGLKYAAWTEN